MVYLRSGKILYTHTHARWTEIPIPSICIRLPNGHVNFSNEFDREMTLCFRRRKVRTMTTWMTAERVVRGSRIYYVLRRSTAWLIDTIRNMITVTYVRAHENIKRRLSSEMLYLLTYIIEPRKPPNTHIHTHACAQIYIYIYTIIMYLLYKNKGWCFSRFVNPETFPPG